VVPISGGKDSSSALYYAVKELGVRAIAVNYDSGFQSDQAVRNIKNACQILGVPLRIYTADFPRRRALIGEVIRIAQICGIPCGVCGNCETNIRTVSIQVAKTYGLRTILFGDSQAENVGSPTFAGLRGVVSRTSGLDLLRLSIPVVKYAAIAARERGSLGVPARYAYTPSMTPVPFPAKRVNVVHLFDYIRWEMIEKVAVLARELGWGAGDDKIDRFDCLLHPLDNFKWLKAAGITKDGFVYCNWIRSGTITREKALAMEERLEKTIQHECVEFVRRFGLAAQGLDWLELDPAQIGG